MEWICFLFPIPTSKDTINVGKNSTKLFKFHCSLNAVLLSTCTQLKLQYKHPSGSIWISTNNWITASNYSLLINSSTNIETSLLGKIPFGEFYWNVGIKNHITQQNPKYMAKNKLLHLHKQWVRNLDKKGLITNNCRTNA